MVLKNAYLNGAQKIIIIYYNHIKWQHTYIHTHTHKRTQQVQNDRTKTRNKRKGSPPSETDSQTNGMGKEEQE